MGMRVKAARSLEALPIRPSRFTQALVADSYSANITDWASADHLLRTSRPVKNAMFSYVYPEKSPDPKVLAVSDSALAALDLDPNVCETDEFAQVFSGNKVLDDTRPWALCYGGHQFGLFAGQLGDGRAVSLFETQNEKGERYEVQLKGAGRTPYSRFGDGYAVLRSSIREFLASEYMHALGIPTTRALTLIGTSREVYRDDAPANVRQPERGAIVTRMAPSWLRFGNFELFYSRDEMSNIRKLADYAIEHVIPPENQQDEKGTGNKYAQFIRRVGKRTAQMAAEWQAVGFNHGVMNTDNMSILGLTLDYGPFQFFDFYDPEYICNHSDTAGQYAFKRQPTVCIFNMFKLGVPLFELIGANDKVDSLVYPGEGPEDEVTDEATRKAYREAGKELVTQMLSQEFSDWFMEHLLFKMRRKLGLVKEPDGPEDMNDLIIPLLDWMTEYHVDNHRFFRSLANYKVTENGEEADAEDAQLDIVCHDAEVLSESKEALKPWLAMYRHRLLQDGPLDNAERKKRMDQVNPRFILRNWIAQEVVDAFDSENQEEQAIDILKACLEACTDPYRNKYEDERIEKWINSPVPEWGRNHQCSCSS